jgi:hypothetical protein
MLVGLMQLQVEERLGGPPGDYRAARNRGWAVKVAPEPGVDWQYWYGDAGVAVVGFDGQNRVTTAQFLTAPIPESFFVRFRRWLGL